MPNPKMKILNGFWFCNLRSQLTYSLTMTMGSWSKLCSLLATRRITGPCFIARNSLMASSWDIPCKLFPLIARISSPRGKIKGLKLELVKEWVVNSRSFFSPKLSHMAYTKGKIISEWKFDVFNFSKNKQKDKESSETDLSWPLISSQLKVLY